MKVYLDNAATTPLDPEVFEAMRPLMTEKFGNPSSIHSHGREVRSLIEVSRKTVSELLNTSPSEIFFMSGGTEADNTALLCSVESLGIDHIITSKLEHPAVLRTAESMEKKGVELDYVQTDGSGNILLDHLESLLKKGKNSLVSLMHANNEIGNLVDLTEIGGLCREYGAKFHSDTVQTIGHLPHDLQSLPIDFIVGSAHKFNGPKGIGFLYIHHETKIHQFVQGGSQERNMRGGTENVYGIVGLAKALEISYSGMADHRKHMEGLKKRMITKLQREIPDVWFNGESADFDKSLYKVLSVSLPETAGNEMLLFNLDINGISASGGSACASGSNIGSHVLTELDTDPNRPVIRFSFGKDNTEEEVDYVVDKLSEIISVGV